MTYEHRELRTVGKQVFRLGLAANYGIDEAGVRSAFERGVNYMFFTSRGKLARTLLTRGNRSPTLAELGVVGERGGRFVHDDEAGVVG